MWIAQDSGGTWYSFTEKPTVGTVGWKGESHAILLIHIWILSWRTTLKEVSEAEYNARYRNKEVR